LHFDEPQNKAYICSLVMTIQNCSIETMEQKYFAYTLVYIDGKTFKIQVHLNLWDQRVLYKETI
jgi:hypothetical protein